ncbi:MAG: glycoside hydrolase family 88 protein [Eubacteriales bacterium]
MKIEIIEKYINKLLAESTPDCPVWNIERLRSGEKPKWNYIDGCMMTALLRMYEQTGESRYFDFVHEFISGLVGDDGKLVGYKEEDYNLDNVFSGNALIDVYRIGKEEKYFKAIKSLLSQLKSQPRTNTGNYWHKLIYPNQIWLDGLYMAQVFRCRYEKYFGIGSEYEDIYMQFKNVRELMFDEQKKLYIHAYDASGEVFWAKENGQSPNAWLRAIGWFAAALADVLEAYPDELQDEKKFLKNQLSEIFDGILPYLDKDSGMFMQVVDYPKKDGNYPETSGSALIGYAMMKSARLKHTDEKWKDIGQKLFESICRKYLKEVDGSLSLGGICLVAGLGPQGNKRRDGTIEYYMSEPIVENEAKGIAPFLYCYAESLY